jgi:hypothetical protein
MLFLRGMKFKDKFYNRRDFISVTAITGLGLSLCLYSCSKALDPVVDDKGDDDVITGIRLTDV